MRLQRLTGMQRDELFQELVELLREIGSLREILGNEAALLAAREDANRVTMQHFERSKDKVLMGAERRSMIISEREKMTIAVHEAGHALLAALVPLSVLVFRAADCPGASAHCGSAKRISQDSPSTRSTSHG